MKPCLLAAVLCCLAAWSAVSLAAAPARAVTPEPPPRQLTDEEIAKLQDNAVIVADKMIDAAQTEIKRIRSRNRPLPEDDAVVQRNQTIVSYCKLYKLKIETTRTLAAYQDKCRREQLTGREHIDYLNALNSTYNETITMMEDTRKDYSAKYGQSIPDPYKYVLDRVFKPDPMKARQAENRQGQP